MSAAPMAQTPVIPPRPSRSSGKEASSGLIPHVPPRPGSKRIERSVSPGVDRFAQSPFSMGIPNSSRDARTDKHYAHKEHASDPIERAGSVPMPSVGEEGMEYSAVTTEISNEYHPDEQAGSPEQTRSVSEDLQIHAPKPSLPASSAKQQVLAVTRTDSDRAASFGIGQPTSSDERAASRGSMRKRPESSYSAYSEHTDDEHGIPNIGQRVPMNKFLGDVQAPSPDSGVEAKKKHHTRKHSARNLPPGSYGLHGHGSVPHDKLEKEYYQKHPDILEREHHKSVHERQNDFAMSSSDLNRLVRDTPSRKVAAGFPDAPGTPSEDVAFRASEEYTRRSSRPTSMSSAQGVQVQPLSQGSPKEEHQHIHVDDARNPEFYNYGEEKAPGEDDEDYSAPILAPDEVQKEPARQARQPAIRPHLERRGSSYDNEESPSRPSSRPRMQRLHSHQQQENEHHTPLEDVKEYEPLFSDETKAEGAKLEKVPTHEEHHHFPSKDIWEDAPSSVHYTAEVSTPDLQEPERRRSSAHHADRPITPAQAFAMYQEELAEKEAKGRANSFLPLSEDKPTWVSHQPHLVAEQRSPNRRRFPSRDIWEDAPESHIHEAELSESPAEANKPDIPARPTKKPSLSPERPAVPSRPKPRQGSGDDATKSRPPVSDKPKPQIPARPSKSLSGDSNDGASAAAASKPKPPVPSRPAGSKIAALQAGFMSDLNKRLQLGPQGVKKEEAPREEEPEPEKEKAPLSDARKGRARGPQRRAPPSASVAAASAASPTDSAKAAVPVLAFSMPKTLWSMDPEDGDFQVARDGEPVAEPVSEPVANPSEQSRKLTESPSPVEPQPQVYEAVPAEPLAAKHGTVEDQICDPLPKSEAKLTPVATEPFAGPAVRDEPKPEESTKEPEAVPDSQHEEKELTLAANTAGESILEADVHAEGKHVEPDEVHEDVKA